MFVVPQYGSALNVGKCFSVLKIIFLRPNGQGI